MIRDVYPRPRISDPGFGYFTSRIRIQGSKRSLDPESRIPYPYPRLTLALAVASLAFLVKMAERMLRMEKRLKPSLAKAFLSLSTKSSPAKKLPATNSSRPSGSRPIPISLEAEKRVWIRYRTNFLLIFKYMSHGRIINLYKLKKDFNTFLVKAEVISFVSCLQGMARQPNWD
jgi:hypothetical protein